MLKNTKDNKANNILLKIDIVAILSLIVAILTLIVAIKTDVFKKPVISLNKVPVTFLINNEYYGCYDLYSEELDNDVNFSDKFATTVNIANPLSNDIQLNEICISMDNIKRDDNPYFKIYACTKEDGVYIDIHNCGWGKAENIKFVFTCFDEHIYEYIGKDTININIESIEVGEIVECPFILNSEIKSTTSFSDFSFSARCTINNMNMYGSIKNTVLDFEIFDNKINVIPMGGSSDFVYGIKFDTDKNSFSYERAILEEINSGEIKILPICIYPDQSCTFDLNIRFRYLYKGKEKYIYYQEKNIAIDIDSSDDTEYIRDINSINQENIEDIYSESLNQIIISYPAVNNFIAYPKCPSCGSTLQCKMNLLSCLNTNKYYKIWYCKNCDSKF